MSKKKSNYYVSVFELCGCCGEFYVSGHHEIKCTVMELKTFINNNQERLFVITDEKLNTVDLCNLFKNKMCDEKKEREICKIIDEIIFEFITERKIIEPFGWVHPRIQKNIEQSLTQSLVKAYCHRAIFEFSFGNVLMTRNILLKLPYFDYDALTKSIELNVSPHNYQKLKDFLLEFQISIEILS